MSASRHPVWIHPAPGTRATACTGCTPPPDVDPDRPLCQAALGGEPCASPQLIGAPDDLQRVLHALQRVVEPEGGRSLLALQLVKSLRIEAGEAELTLTYPLHCGSGRQLADDAFHSLRRLLPDTDVYVRHAA